MPDTAEGRAAGLINAFRALAGLRPVALDPTLSDGCRAHAEYLKINRGKPQIYALAAHDEDVTLPGATPAGAACAKAANLHTSATSVDGAIRAWMGSLYHRRPILTPEVERVGVGFAELYGMVIVAIQFAYAQSPVHIAITLQVPWIDSVTNVVATLDDGASQLPIFFSSPERPAVQGMPNYGVIAMIPTQTLRPSTRYRATISAVWNGTPQTWLSTFTTAP